MKDNIKQYDLPEGSRVMIQDPENRNFVKMKFRGMKGAYGKWELAGEILLGNYYGTFHLNKSQKYYYYEPEEE